MGEERLYKPISEVADELKLPTHVIRFWETKFSIVSPIKRAGGRRFYTEDDIIVLKAIKDLLYNHSYSIKSVQKAIDDGYFSDVIKIKEDDATTEDSVLNENNQENEEVVTLDNEYSNIDLKPIISELEEIKKTLDSLI